MTNRSNRSLACLALGAASLGAQADPTLTIEVPQLSVAQYHRPYVAAWVERDGVAAAQLGVWYDQRKPNKGGTKWLPDVRQWWRKGGRDMAQPVDGVSGATRAPGEHAIQVGKALTGLPPGAYELIVEAAREGGGREVLRLPLQLPLNAAARSAGEHELGKVSLAP